jgi:glycerol-3-phosphate cytidylyltransferase
MIKGYTSGVFDLFHIGHLRLLKNAKKECDYLIVGVCTDKLVLELKGKKPIIPLEQRIEILKELPFVNEIVIKNTDNDTWIAYKLKAKIIFKGSDWKGKKKWKWIETNAKVLKIKTKIIPYTKCVSSTKIRGKLNV